MTGFIFIAGNPVGGPMEYLTNLSLQLKMLIVLIAGINLLIFYVAGIERSWQRRARRRRRAGGAKVVAAVSIVAWIIVIVMGRFIMYNDTLLYALGPLTRACRRRRALAGTSTSSAAPTARSTRASRRICRARIAAHNDGRGAKYTRQRLPVKLVYRKRLPTAPPRSAASTQIKRLPRDARSARAAALS